MNAPRSPKSTYVAAFLLGGVIALLVAAPARSAEVFRLDRIPIVRFTAAAENQLVRRTGVLNISGDVAWRITQTIPRPANTLAWALDRNLVNVTTWLAFHSLGGLALAIRATSLWPRVKARRLRLASSSISPPARNCLAVTR
jgi:hypothetical protein